LPQVVVPGCIDFSVFHAGAIPPPLRDRPVYDHNPEYTLVRTSPDEMLELADLFAERLSEATGPIRIAIPTEGLSIPNEPGGVFWDPESDAAFVKRLKDTMRSDIPITTHAKHVNDPAFGEDVANLFIEMVSKEEITS
jgi:uncharacterized protein (UPF0261 family)